MNIFIFALYVNLLTLVNAVNDINFATILKILQPKQRQAEYSNIEEANDPVEVVPIIPGFDLQKPNDLSKSLFKSPTPSPSSDQPDEVLGVLSREATRQSKTNIGTNTKNKSTTDNYLNKKILKAVRNLNKYRENQKPKKNKFKKNKVKKMLGRMFKTLKGNMYFREKKINKKPYNRAIDDSSDAKVLGDLLKSLMNGNTNYNKYRGKKHAYRYYETEEQSQEGGDFLEGILNAIQNNNQGPKTQEAKIIQRPPTMIIISTAPIHDNELEMENDAKESMEVFDDEYDGSNLHNLHQTRRQATSEKGSTASSSSESEDSSYERNPGNPFTVHKNKYKQNWPYNHYMDGDHMNISPLGPQFGHMGPTGPELFFGRKWWYFNQDDFKPMG